MIKVGKNVLSFSNYIKYGKRDTYKNVKPSTNSVKSKYLYSN